MCKPGLSDTNQHVRSTYTEENERGGEGERGREGESRRERQRENGNEGEAIKSQRETPCVGTSGWHSAGCLQSVILTSFPDKQISMLEKDIMI